MFCPIRVFYEKFLLATKIIISQKVITKIHTEKGRRTLPLPCVSATASRAHARTFGRKAPPGGARAGGTSAGPPPAGALPVAGPISTFFGHAFNGHGHPRYSARNKYI